MPTYIIRFDDQGEAFYLEWSTVVDAPVTRGLPRDQFVETYTKGRQHEFAFHQPGSTLSERLERVDVAGCSAMRHSVNELIAFNRAGLKETCLTKEQIINHYVRGEPNVMGERV